LTFDGRLLDGLLFCKRVYDLFEQILNGPHGLTNIRLRPSKEVKRLIEELIPIAQYIQRHYSVGRRIKVRWLSGSQSYDAVILSSGSMVDVGAARVNTFETLSNIIY